MRLIQTISGISILYFMAQVVLSDSQQAQMVSLMGAMIMFLIFLIASHYHGVQNKDITDEIRQNHKRTSASNNGTNSIYGSKKANTNVTK